MNLVWHQFKKDLSYLRLLVVLGLTVLLIRLLNLAGIDYEWAEYFSGLVSYNISNVKILYGLQFIAMTVLIVRLVHSEPAVGSRAFWLTRPISSKILLQSKALFIVVFLVVIPILLELIVLAFFQFSTSQLIQAGLELLISNLFWIAIVVPIAVLTRNFSQFAVVILVLAILHLLTPYFKKLIPYVASDLSLDASREIMTQCFVILCCFAVVLYQYRTRYVLRSINLCLGIILIQFSLNTFWPFDFFRPQTVLSKDYSSRLKLELNTNAIPVSDFLSRGKEPWKSVASPLDFFCPDPGIDFEPREITSQLEYPNGKLFRFDKVKANFFAEPLPSSIQTILGEEIKLYQLHRSPSYLYDISEKNYVKYAQKMGRLKMKLNFTTLRYRKVAELDLKVGLCWQNGPQKIEIKKILRKPQAINLRLNYRWADLKFKLQRFDHTDAPDLYFILLNSKTKEAIWAGQDNYVAALNFFLGGGPKLKRHLSFIRFGDSAKNSDPLPFKLNSAWLADAKLVLLEPYVVGGGEKEFQFENFIMEKE